MAKRYQTYFGVPIPPWKEKKLGAGSITIRFVITGVVPSKKNNQLAVCRRKEAAEYLKGLFRTKNSITQAEAFTAIGKVFAKMRPNEPYKKFVSEQREIIGEQMKWWAQRLGKKGLSFPITGAALSIRFYFAHKYRQDSVNKQQTIQDLLKDCQIICDDDYTTINPITAAAHCYHEEIIENITFISISFRL